MDTRLFEQAQEQAEYCRVFSNAKRVLILWFLGTEEMSVSDIASALDASLQNTSQHLRVMKDRGVLSSRREGQIKYYRVEKGDCLINHNPISVQTLHVERNNLIEKQT
jgi:ArsR family transcriptional regulator